MIFSSFDKATDNTNFAHAVQVKPPLGRHLQKALLALLLECPCCMAPSFHGATDPLRSLSLFGISNRRYPVEWISVDCVFKTANKTGLNMP